MSAATTASAAPAASPWLDRIARALDALVALALAVMVVMVFGNVVLRYVFNSGIAVSEELSRWLFVWMTFLGAIVAVKEHGHLGSDTVVSRLPPLGKKICLIVGQLLMLYVNWLLFAGSLAQVKINWDVSAPVTGASMAIVYSAGIVFAVATSVLLLRETWRALTGRIAERDLVMVKESEEAAELEHLQAELAREAAAEVARNGDAKRNGAEPPR